MSIGARLLALFNRAPEAAMQYLAGKRLVVTNTWRDLTAAAHAHSFTVARAAKLDILADILDSLLEAQANGVPYAEWARKLRPTLQAKGWWGYRTDPDTGEMETYVEGGRPVELGSMRRLETIYRTNMQSAFMAGRRKQIEAEAAEAPYVQYIAVMDGRTRPSHAALNGRVFRVDDPVWQSCAPPNGYNCRCRIRNLDAAEVRERGLSVSSSAGYLKRETVPDRTGREVTRTVLRLPGMDRAFSPDLGFDQAPDVGAERALQAKLAAADPAVRAAAERDRDD